MLKTIPPALLFFFGSLGLWAQAPAEVAYTLYLVGDAGEPAIVDQPLGKALRREVSASGANATVVYLGDNIYPKGMPPVGSKQRAISETILKTQAGWIQGLDAKGIFLPGNHDWQRARRRGQEYILNQQQFLDSLHDNNITLLPRDACPGPVEIPLTEKAVLVILDTQWLLHPWDKPGEESDCDAKTPAEVWLLLSDIFARNAGKRVIVAAHHPLITHGEHGGVFQLKDHLFPLTAANHNLYIPMPVIGSIYPLYRKWFGDVQDAAHPLYKEMSGLIQNLMLQYPGSVYAAGHEHALQYLVRDSLHLIVSGAGSKTSFVKQKQYSKYAGAVQGYVKLTLYTDGSALTEYKQVDETYPEGKSVYSDKLPALHRMKPLPEQGAVSFKDKVVRVKASEQYAASKTHERLLGANYRSAWGQEIDVPVFDIATEQGGLKIVQKGGGMQTLSLRLEDSTGREFVLRSIEKYPENAVPEMLRKTFAQDLVQDQISASHPYSAVVVPGLADAAQIYHTNPRIVYIPDDARLGIYRRQFANTLSLFEERPAGDWSDKAFFGNSKNIINTSKVLERTEKDNDNQVDQRFVLRSRIFDLWIGDWDRHDDQWRWSSFKTKKGETYRPVPRDRDQAFFVNEGVIPKIWSRKWALPKFEGFAETIRWPSGLSFNARYFDRTFLTEPSEDEWVAAAKDLQLKLTDEVIETSIKAWPIEIYDLHGKEVIQKLKVRRENLVKDAVLHYKFLAKAVEVVGSEKDEKFDVQRQPSGDVLVKVYKYKDGEEGKKLYERLFKKFETKEIRLYGRGGKDLFAVTGTTPQSILVRVIGGDGKDTLRDESHVTGLANKTLFYDLKEGSTVVTKGETGNRMSDDSQVNEWDRKAFKYNTLAPLVTGNVNPDDGLFIGGGFLYQTQGFRKSPFKSRHFALFSVAPRTASFNLSYRGDFNNVVGKWGLQIIADLKQPNYVNNFFGWGNESVYDLNIDDKPQHAGLSTPIEYYRYRFEEWKLEAYITRRIGNWGLLQAGPAFQRVEVEDPGGKDRFIEEYAATLPYPLFDGHNTYTGGAWKFTVDKRNNPIFTTRGVVFAVSGRNMAGVDMRAHSFSSYESSLSLYHSFRFPSRIVFAARVGGGLNTGTYEFYQAQILSGRTEIRGFRKTRFYGDSRLYSNLEMRIKLLSLKTYLFPASLGIVGFHDFGRVWYKDANGNDPSTVSGKSSEWHRGWGGGLWFTPFNLTILSVEAAHSEEGTLGYIRMGFLF
ncbi:BamA/TamA family outer membrane protein [Chryseolinea lacunae]|uniref:BamA/TamA family outer membrane protein n=1 Tax=Chryseolinea lacunae TaxID=2801331 RepID=A0ABS1KYW9_9BACT|nr:BamA/TamA family outer membrane protein [Chryseolinea lacunae]MBL0744373.1 BamA/TamA family outer membrane protein [Chryseolinea lacunae]